MSLFTFVSRLRVVPLSLCLSSVTAVFFHVFTTGKAKEGLLVV